MCDEICVSILPVSKIGQGTWQMERDDRAACVRALQRGLDLGLSHVDTAEMYGAGVVERIVGEAIAGRRDEVFLASKVLPDNATYEGTLAACEQSLRRLGVERLDLYMLHWPGSHPLEETFAAFQALVAQGKIARYGVSNFDIAELERVLAIVGVDQLACNQVLYHLGDRAIEHRLIPWCAEHGVPVVAYSPFGSGSFPDDDPTLLEIASRHGNTPRQIALAFLVRHAGVWTIPKAARIDHVEDNAAALDISLTDDDTRAIDRSFPRGRRRSLGWI
jgi:diketogulonate reductase-like aldo/keto reductase